MAIRPPARDEDDDEVLDDGAIVNFGDHIVFELNTAADHARVFGLLNRWAERESDDKAAGAAVFESEDTVEDFRAQVLNQWSEEES